MKSNNYLMQGKDGIDPKEMYAIWPSDMATTIHKHDFVEIVYFQSGVGTHVIGGKTFSASHGNVCVLNTGVEHSYSIENDLDKPISVVNIIFYPALIDERLSSDNFIDDFYYLYFKKHLDKNKTPQYIHISYDLNKEIAYLFQILTNEFKEKGEGYLINSANIVSTILIKILREYNKDSKEGISNANKSLVENILLYLTENITREVTLTELSEKYYFSEYYLSKLIKAYSGMNFKEYFQNMKCKEACRLLAETNMSVTHISEHLGYAYTKQFYFLFKRFVGTTPKEFRNNHGKEKA